MSNSGETRRRGLFSTILVSAATSSGSAMQVGVVVPLKTAGYQYVTNVSISEGNTTLVRTRERCRCYICLEVLPLLVAVAAVSMVVD